MQKFINFFFLLSITLYINFSNARSIDSLKNDSSLPFDNSLMGTEEDMHGDNYYLVFVNYTSTASSKKSHNKRQEEENHKEFVYSLMDEINELIVENVDTYENPEIVEEIISNEQLRKRNEQINQDNIGTVIRLSTVENISVLSAYLSEKLIDDVKGMHGVYDFIPNRHFKIGTTYNINDIKKQTNWTNVMVRESAYGHLSLISQGKYNRDLVSEFDRNYYFPESAGRDVDVYVVDTGFNFNSDEFDDSHRTVKCLGVFDPSGNYTDTYNRFFTEKRCFPSNVQVEHGTAVADMVGGINYGVAPNANIYGLAVPFKPTYASVFASLDYIIEHILKVQKENNQLRKSIFNFSFGGYSNLYGRTNEIIHFENLINTIVNVYDGVVVACAHNQGSPVKYERYNAGMFPCIFDNVICVGATESIYLSNYIFTNFMRSDVYRKADFSNYGEGVDIYAPGLTTTSFVNLENNYYYYNTYGNGTSFATPIVSGIAATVMSEDLSTTFNSRTMLTRLKQISIKNAIENIKIDDPSNYFANNGKHIVYSYDDYYMGCGINSGYQKCPNNECCSSEGYCINDKDSCKVLKGCQPEYGLCQD